MLSCSWGLYVAIESEQFAGRLRFTMVIFIRSSGVSFQYHDKSFHWYMEGMLFYRSKFSYLKCCLYFSFKCDYKIGLLKKDLFVTICSVTALCYFLQRLVLGILKNWFKIVKIKIFVWSYLKFVLNIFYLILRCGTMHLFHLPMV